MTNTDDRSTAFHEAAHAVATHHLLDPGCVGALTIVPDRGALGHFAPVPVPDLPALVQAAPRDAVFDLVRADVITRYAGAAAELRLDPESALGRAVFTDPSPDEEATADEIAEGNAVQVGGNDDRGDAEVLLAFTVDLGFVPRAGRGRLREELRSLAHHFVAEYWAQISSLGEQLYRRKTMTGPQVRRALRTPPAARRRRPTTARPSRPSAPQARKRSSPRAPPTG